MSWCKNLADARGCRIPEDSFSCGKFIDFYQREIVHPMIQGYADGIPKSNILCNRKMKFGALMKYAKNMT